MDRGMTYWLGKLQGKFLMGLLIAAALPCFIGLVLFEGINYQHEIQEAGRIHHMEAVAMVSSIHQSARAEAEKFRAWLELDSSLMRFVLEQNNQLIGQAPEAIKDQVQLLDDVWPSLPNDDPQVQAVLGNPGAASLVKYTKLHHKVAEVIVTDSTGRLIAATNKTTDVNQSDEVWWKGGAAANPRGVWIDALHYDSSAHFYVIGVSLPLYHHDEFMGVAKISLLIRDLMPRMVIQGFSDAANWSLLLRDGQVLLDSKFGKLRKQNSDPSYAILQGIGDRSEGWMVATDENGAKAVMGFRALTGDSLADGDSEQPNAYVVFSSNLDEIWIELWRQTVVMLSGGVVLLALCLLAAYFLLRRKVLSPIEEIQRAVMSLSRLARIRKEMPDDFAAVRNQHTLVANHLRIIQRIRTGDQMETLARHIAILIERVLNYEAEVDRNRDASATAEETPPPNE